MFQSFNQSLPLLGQTWTNFLITIKWLIRNWRIISPELWTFVHQVPNSYYPVRKLSSLTLYQDAHSAKLPNVRGPKNCFEDIYNSILTAKKFIYISGRFVNLIWNMIILDWVGNITRCNNWLSCQLVWLHHNHHKDNNIVKTQINFRVDPHFKLMKTQKRSQTLGKSVLN